eukprot:5341098-Pleurochrysis_carterae.AAC.9
MSEVTRTETVSAAIARSAEALHESAARRSLELREHTKRWRAWRRPRRPTLALPTLSRAIESRRLDRVERHDARDFRARLRHEVEAPRPLDTIRVFLCSLWRVPKRSHKPGLGLLNRDPGLPQSRRLHQVNCIATGYRAVRSGV